MNNQVNCAAFLENILRTEISVLTDLYACQKRMYECVLIRDWISLQRETANSDKLVEVFLAYEANRTSTLQAFLPGMDGSLDFYLISVQFPDPERSRINSLFRDMKRLLLLSKSENEVFNTYITNARTIVSGLLETMVPARRNKIYTRHGGLASANVENLVLNRSL